MLKDKQGNKLTFKEYLKRWSEGINGITKKQQIKMQIQSMYIVLLGMSIGIFVLLFNFKTMWWVAIVLVGALINLIITQIANYQRKEQLKKVSHFFTKIKEETNEQHN